MTDINRFNGNPNKKRKRHRRKPAPPGTLKVRELAPYVKTMKKAVRDDFASMQSRLESTVQVVTHIKLVNPDLLVACVDELLSHLLDASFSHILTRWIDIIGGVPYELVEVDGILRPVAVINEKVINVRAKATNAEATRRRRVRQRIMEDKNIRARPVKAAWQAEYRQRKALEAEEEAIRIAMEGFGDPEEKDGDDDEEIVVL